MNAPRPVAARLLAAVLAITFAQLFAAPARATTYYWDVDGGTAGFSTVTGAWDGVNLFWNSDPSGGNSGSTIASPTSAELLNISGGSAGTITISTVGAGSALTISDNAAITITGG